MAGPRPNVRAAAAVLAVAAAAAGVSQAFGRFTFSLLFTDVTATTSGCPTPAPGRSVPPTCSPT
ncbi:MAG: hypothetical protein R2749_02615 [Acidimicrobiales bacterium]